jgi:hypothetical protein
VIGFPTAVVCWCSQLGDATAELTKLQAAAAEFASKDATARDQITALRKANATAERKAADQVLEVEALQRRLLEAEGKLGEVRC